MINKAKYIIGAVCLLLGMGSCSDMLENESSRQLFNPEINEKTDSLFYALGILQGMQQLADQYVFQGEMRGDLVKTTTYTDNNLRQLASFEATTANKYDSAYVYYRVINNCNYYIAHCDTMLNNGAIFVMMKEYVAVKSIRAWAYLQLARNYGKVKFYTEPLTQISQIDNNTFDMLDLPAIVNHLAPDLEQYSGTNYALPPTYNGENSAPNESKFDPTKVFIPLDIVLGDLYLETEQFDKAANHYITYLTQVEAEKRNIAYTTPYTSRRRGPSDELLPGDWGDNNNSQSGSASWNFIFSPSITSSSVSLSQDIITYIPMARSSQQGYTSIVPKTFGYDFYSTDLTNRYIDEIQIQPSDDYVALSNAQDYYYYSSLSNTGTNNGPVINSAKLGDARYAASTYENLDTESDSTTVWITKYNYANIILYRTTTVMMHLAEALNRMGYYDAAFAILKDGINEYLIKSSEDRGANYLSDETKQALQTTVPILSAVNLPKFTPETTSGNAYTFGVHSHGTGYARDYYGTYRPGLSPYQLGTAVEAKMNQIASDYNITIGNTPQDSINAVEDLLCDEYALEFAFEGNRFYDLCRLARHKNTSTPAAYGANFGGRWLARKLAYKNPSKSLEEEDNWYLPFK